MKLGNIVSNQNLSQYSDFNYFKEHEDIDNDLPTLIIGFNIVHKVIPDFDMYKRNIDYKTFWTFNLREKRDLHNEDVHKFTAFCYKRLIDKNMYVYIDPFNYDFKGVKKIVTKIKEATEPIAFYYESMVYLKCENLTFGFNLDAQEFLGINRQKFLDKIKNISDVFLDDKEILIEYINHMEYLNNEVKYIPLLYSIINEK